MKKYFKHLSLGAIFETTIILIATLLINIFFIYLSRPAYAQYIDASNEWIYHMPIVLPGIMMITTTGGVLFILLLKAYKLKSKHYTDMMYALPISRRKLISTHLIVGVIQVVIIVTVSFIGSVLVFYALSNQAFNMGLIWLIYPLLLVLALVLYSLFQLLIYRANNIVDAITLIFGYLVLLMIVAMIIQYIRLRQYTYIDEIDEFMVFPYFSFDKLSILLLRNATPNTLGTFDKHYLLPSEVNIVLANSINFIILSIVSVIYTIFKVKTDKVENIGGVTTSYLGYKVLNPLIVFFSSLFLFQVTGNFVVSIFYILPMLLVIFYVIYIIYRRKFIISKVDFLVVGSTIALSYMTSILMNIWI